LGVSRGRLSDSVASCYIYIAFYHTSKHIQNIPAIMSLQNASDSCRFKMYVTLILA